MFAMVLANISSNMGMMLIPLYLNEMGASITEIGFVFTIISIVSLVLQVFGGWISDSIGRLKAIAIAAMAISLNVALQEGVHALTCLAVGGDLLEYSALYEECDSPTNTAAKIVAGSAPTFNLIAGIISWSILRSSRKRTSETQFFLWLFMLMNWCYGAGYFIFSGISNVGDWAVVISGWEPNWLWRLLMVIMGMLHGLLHRNFPGGFSVSLVAEIH